MLAPKVMYLHTKFEVLIFIHSQDIVWKPHDKSVTDRRTCGQRDRQTEERTDGKGKINMSPPKGEK